MVDALVSGASVERRAGSIPVLGTNNIFRTDSYRIVFEKKKSTVKIFSYKFVQIRCGKNRLDS